jgi:hypothetical protein
VFAALLYGGAMQSGYEREYCTVFLLFRDLTGPMHSIMHPSSSLPQKPTWGHVAYVQQAGAASDRSGAQTVQAGSAECVCVCVLLCGPVQTPPSTPLPLECMKKI